MNEFMKFLSIAVFGFCCGGVVAFLKGLCNGESAESIYVLNIAFWAFEIAGGVSFIASMDALISERNDGGDAK